MSASPTRPALPSGGGAPDAPTRAGGPLAAFGFDATVVAPPEAVFDETDALAHERHGRAGAATWLRRARRALEDVRRHERLRPPTPTPTAPVVQLLIAASADEADAFEAVRAARRCGRRPARDRIRTAHVMGAPPSERV